MKTSSGSCSWTTSSLSGMHCERSSRLTPVSQLWAKPATEKRLQRCDPSVVVMDIQMPRLNGIQATALIKQFFPHVIVVRLSVHATEDLRQGMITAGATRTH